MSFKSFKKVLILFFCLLFITGCIKKETGDFVLCGTTIISSMVRDISGENKIKTLIPHLVCPGTYDLKPDDAKKISNAKILILHPFQKYLTDKILKINKKTMVFYITSSNLNTPDGYINGLNEILNFLSKRFPDKKQHYLKNNQIIRLKIKAKMTENIKLINEIKDKKIKVLTSIHQKSFCEYLGLQVVATFSGPDSLKIQDASKIIKLAKNEKVRYIISNLTGDNDITADILNKELKIKKIILMYFPAEEGMDSYFFNVYNYNLEQIKSEIM